MDVNEREKLCEILYTRAEYKGKILFAKNKLSGGTYSRRTSVILHIRTEKLRKTINVEVFRCVKFKMSDNSFRLQRFYKIMAGPENDSVILLESLHNYHRAIELIKYLHYYNSVNIDKNY